MSTAKISPTPSQQGGPPFLMALPALLLFAVFALVPMGIVVYLSFTRWDGLGSPAWAGTGNWHEVLTSDVTRHALWLTLKFMVVSWLVQTPISLLLGVFVAGQQRYRALLAVFYFVPPLIPTAATAITFKNPLGPNFGLGGSLDLPDGLSFMARCDYYCGWYHVHSRRPGGEVRKS